MVLPTYGRPDLLERAIVTVFAQTFQAWELIVVDDNGTGTELQEQTAAVVAAVAADPRVVYVVHDRNRGGGAARNTGIRRARAPFVAFLDDDDAWYPTKLELQVACFDESPPEVALVYGAFRRVAEDGTSRLVVPVPGGDTVRDLLRRNAIGTTSVALCRRDALLAVEGFDETLRSRQDVDLFLRLRHRYRFAYVQDALLDKHQHDGDAIGKNYTGVVDAYGRFYAKHRAAYQGDRGAHHVFLTRYGLEALRAEQIALARSLLWQGWLLDRRALRNLALVAFADRRLLHAYRMVRRWMRRSWPNTNGRKA
ncbi:MAG: glycosyltransferase family A protein [Trueperaceae bacterium]|nr:glycosyltransferase family A protein [Trueperaceae bacterium]